MEAVKGSRASWGWSSILVGRDLLAKKLMWRVGDGRSISIWDDKWNPDIHSGGLGGYQSGLGCNLQMVEEIIVNKRWCLDELKHWISKDEYCAIMRIPVAQGYVADKLI